MEEAPQAHIAMFSTPGMGHLIPLLELARKLFHVRTLTITFIIPDDGSPTKPQKDLLQKFQAIKPIFLPPISLEDLPEDAKIETRICLSLIRSIPALLKVLADLNRSNRLSALVSDFFGSVTFQEVKDQLGIPMYLFCPSSLMALSFALYLPELHESCTCEYRDLPEPVKLPGCVPVSGPDLVDPVQDRKNEAYEAALQMCKNFTLPEGILLDSFLELEPRAFQALEQGLGFSNMPPVYPIGPMIRPGSETHDKAECLKWLDEQPVGSVLYVSFGSGGTLSSEQLKELALGLQLSDQRFLLVVKTPNDKARNAAYFCDGDNEMDPYEYLPSEFMERTKGKGLVVPDWAPQIEVLSHTAVGGFLSHCGWNSTLESIVNGVPLIAWPLFGEQRMNAVLLSEDLKVAERVREDENGLVDREQVSRLVRRLMEREEGKQRRCRMRDLKDAAARALGEDGSSTRALGKVVATWIGEGVKLN